MAVIENEGIWKVKDEKGNVYLMYPITKADLVAGLDDLLAEKADRSHTHTAATSSTDGFMSADDKKYLSGMNTALAAKADRKTLLELNRADTHVSVDEYTTEGMFWINPSITTDIPGKQWGFMRVFANGGVILQEFTPYQDSNRAIRMYVNSAWTSWHREQYGTGNGWSYCIHPDGSVDLWCRQVVSNAACTTALGSWYRTAALHREAFPFNVTDPVTSATYYPSDGNGGLLWCLGQEGSAQCAQFYLVRHTSVASLSGYIEYHVHGTYAGGSVTPGTKA